MQYSDEITNESAVQEDRATSVLIVTHQSEADIDRCLRSLKLAAPRSRLEVLALDNASTDQTVARLRAAEIPVICSNENIGFAAGASGAVIPPEARIGHGAGIGANSEISKDIAP